MTPFASVRPRAAAQPSALITRPDLKPRSSGNFCITPRLPISDDVRRQKLIKPMTNGR